MEVLQLLIEPSRTQDKPSLDTLVVTLSPFLVFNGYLSVTFSFLLLTMKVQLERINTQLINSSSPVDMTSQSMSGSIMETVGPSPTSMLLSALINASASSENSVTGVPKISS